MEILLLLAVLAIMAPFITLAGYEEILDSPTFHVTLAALLACAYQALSMYKDRKAHEAQTFKSCQAKAAEQASPSRAELQTLHARISSQAKTIASHNNDMRYVEAMQQSSAAKIAEHERVNRHLRRRLEDAESESYDRTTVMKARAIEAQWDSVRGAMAEAGIDIDTQRGGWTSAVKELCQPKSRALSAVKDNNVAVLSALDKEKAARNAAEKQLAAMTAKFDLEKNRARIFELTITEMELAADREKRHESHRGEEATAEAAMRGDFERQLAEESSRVEQLYDQEYAKLLEKFNEAGERQTSELKSDFSKKNKKLRKTKAKLLEDAKNTAEETAASTNKLQQELEEAKKELGKAQRTITEHETAISALKQNSLDQIKSEQAAERGLKEQLSATQTMMASQRKSSKRHSRKTRMAAKHGNAKIASLNQMLVAKNQQAAYLSAEMDSIFQQQLNLDETMVDSSEAMVGTDSFGQLQGDGDQTMTDNQDFQTMTDDQDLSTYPVMSDAEFQANVLTDDEFAKVVVEFNKLQN